MNLEMTISDTIVKRYTSRSHIAGVLSEAWFEQNMYCPACPSDHLDKLAANTKVIDFICPKCDETFQLKSKSHPFGRSVQNSEYFTKIEKIKKGESPNWVFLKYNISNFKFQVQDIFIIPRHFMTIEAIQRRKELRPTAQRHGWVGSIIRLDRFPPDAKLIIISNSLIAPFATVRDNWEKYHFLSNQNVESKGWLSDILKCVRELNKQEFKLNEVYDHVEELRHLHPNNKHIEAKIRQQLQVLQKNGILDFVGRGVYRFK